MVTAVFQLDHGLAVEAALPARVFRYFQELSCISIGRAMLGLVPLVVAYTTYLSFAFSTCGTGAAVAMMAMILRPDPCSAFRSGAIVAVSGGELGIFFVPSPFEIIVEHIIDVLEGNDVRGTASGWHVLGILN